MKAIILSLTLTISSMLCAQSTSEADNTIETGTTITVTVPVQSSEGSVLFGLYDEAGFLQQPLQSQEGTIKDGKATIVFTDVVPGTYAVSLFHDKNGNKQMDFDTNGMPLEMYGISNNVMNYGPPQWSDAKFEVSSEPVSLTIRM